MSRSFTKSGLSIPSIGLGTWELRGQECRRVVREALELGYRHIDTAAMYENELEVCLLYTSPSPRDGLLSRMPSSA